VVTCPICGASVAADFGMVTCASCESVFMVEIDGTVTLPEAAPAAPEPDDATLEAALFEEPGETPQPSEEDLSGMPAHQPEGQADDFTGLSPSEETTEYVSPTDDAAFSAAEETTTEAAGEEPPAEDSGALPEAEPEYSEDFLNDLDGTEAKDDKADPLGVSQFDVAEASQVADGLYYYDLRISGIDTASIKQQVLDILSDKRLGWNAEELRKKIKMGQLVIENLNPVRAVLAVLKLQSLDVDVEWDQRPFTDDGEAPKDRET